MRIGIDARMLGPQTGGIGRYTEQLVKHLQVLDTEHVFVLFLSDKNWDAVEASDRIEKVKAPIQWYSLKEQLLFSKMIKKEKLDLMHFPHWNVPLLFSDPFVVTVHDLIMFHFPRPEATTLGPIMYWLKDRVHRLVVRHAIKKSKKVIVPTQWVRQDIIDTFRVDESHIVVTYESHMPPRDLDGYSTNVLETHGIMKPFGVYVGSGFPHENLEMLSESWDHVHESTGAQLVFVGSTNKFYKKLEEKFSGRGDIVFTGFVSDDDLAYLYKEADICVFPSKSEGFGLPPLEAMSYGTPVASSSASCMPEVQGEASLYFDPDDKEHMAQVITHLLEDEDLQFELNQRAKHELKRYSWMRLSQETLAIYNSLDLSS